MVAFSAELAGYRPYPGVRYMAEDHLSGAGQGVAATLSALGASVPSVPRDLRVDPDQLLAVAKVINEQADALDGRIRQNLTDLKISPPALDVISTTAVDAWNRLVAHGYAARVQDYVGDLRNLAAQLRKAAQAYQAGEEDKVAALGNRTLK